MGLVEWANKKAQERATKRAYKQGFTCGRIIADHPMPLPTKGASYVAYDDGKRSPSREYSVCVTDILPYKKLPKEIKKLWRKEVAQCYWLYAPSSDYFIKAIVSHSGEEQYFARTFGDSWFALSAGDLSDCGELDVDRSIQAEVYCIDERVASRIECEHQAAAKKLIDDDSIYHNMEDYYD